MRRRGMGGRILYRSLIGRRIRLRVGLLGSESAAEPEDIKMGGLLGVVGKDEELSMFPPLFTLNFQIWY